jgi:hypothetical protein
MDYIERNYRILEQKMIDQMEEALGYGKELINKELDAGFLNFLIRPVIQSFYNYWCDNDVRVGTIQQIKVTLDCAKLLLNNNEKGEKGEGEKFENVIEQNYLNYLKGDQTFRQCKKNHKNFEKLKKNAKEAFQTQVQEAILFLGVTDDSNTYDNLVKSVFKTKEKALFSLTRQLNFNDMGIKVVEQDSTILKMPTGRNIIVKVLRKGFEKTKEDLIKRLDHIF